jgi:hypothetical protein
MQLHVQYDCTALCKNSIINIFQDIVQVTLKPSFSLLQFIKKTRPFLQLVLSVSQIVETLSES